MSAEVPLTKEPRRIYFKDCYHTRKLNIMKKTILLLTITLLTVTMYSQVAINTTGDVAVPSAMLEVTSTTKGMLIPRMTTAQRNDISSPATGLLVFDTTTGGFWYFGGSSWTDLSSGLPTGITDADGDTYVEVDNGSDPDYVNVAVAGDNYWRFGNGRLEILNTGGSILIGENAGLNDDFTSNDNIFIGKSAGYSTTSGLQNVAIGRSALSGTTTGSANTSIGAFSLSTNGGSYNVAVGLSSLYYTTIGKYNSAIGTRSLLNNTTGTSNVAVGVNALYSSTTQSHNVAIGDSALYYNGVSASSSSQSSNNVGVGSKALFANTTGYQNSALGYNAMYSNTTGYGNAAFGSHNTYSNTSGNQNTAFGTKAMYSNTTGNINAAYGYQALYSNTSGQGNVAIGAFSSFNLTTGIRNVGVGRESGYNNQTGDNNVSLGYKAHYQNTASDNIAVGYNSAYQNSTGSGNISIGKSANYNNQTGENNTILGYEAGKGSGLHSKSGNVFIGYQAGFTEIASNKLYIQNSDTTKPLIYGDFNTKLLGFNADNVGIGTQSPIGKLHIHDNLNSNSIVYITPKTTGAEDSSTVFFAEDHDATYGMYWMYDGVGNQMELFGKRNGTDYGPHIIVDRNDGDVAIGENFATGYKLSVDGKVACEEVRVALQADWPDYVFASDYKLRSIKDMESFIQENHHLPNIPAADEIEASGLEMGEMQRKMMEKIEELSLYIIDLQKQIEELKSQN